jgi:hypothetical protein
VPDLLERRRSLRLEAVGQPALEIVQDRVARVPAHADDEGKAEALAIGRVQPLEARELCLAQPVEPEAALLPARLRGHGAGTRDLAAELRVAADQAELLGLAGGGNGLHHGAVQIGDRRERPRRKGPLRHPRRALEDAAERADEGALVGGIEFACSDFGCVGVTVRRLVCPAPLRLRDPMSSGLACPNSCRGSVHVRSPGAWGAGYARSGMKRRVPDYSRDMSGSRQYPDKADRPNGQALRFGPALMSRLDALGAITEIPGQLTRRYLSPAHIESMRQTRPGWSRPA